MSNQELTLDNTHKNDKLELETLPAESASSLKSLLSAQPINFQRKTNTILLILGMIMVSKKSENYLSKINKIYKFQTKNISETTQQKISQIGKQIATTQIEKVMQLIKDSSPKQGLQQFFAKIHQTYQTITKNQILQLSFTRALRQYVYQRFFEKSQNCVNEFLNIDENIILNDELELRGDALDLCCHAADISLNFVIRTIHNEIIEKYGKQSSELQIQIKLEYTTATKYIVNLCYFPLKQSSQNSQQSFQTKSIKTIYSPKNSMQSLNKKKWQRNPSSEKSVGKCRICMKHNQFCFCRKSRKQFSNEEQSESRQLSKLKFYRNYGQEKENFVLGNQDKKCKRDYLQMYQNKLVKEFKLKHSSQPTQSIQ